MTVKELRRKLQGKPDNMQIFVAERMTEFKYGLVNSVREKEINLMEEPEGEILATEMVVILDEA